MEFVLTKKKRKLTEKKGGKIHAKLCCVLLPLCATYFLQLANKITPNTAKKSFSLALCSPLLANTFDKYLKGILLYRGSLNFCWLKYFINGYSASFSVVLPLGDVLLCLSIKNANLFCLSLWLLCKRIFLCEPLARETLSIQFRIRGKERFKKFDEFDRSSWYQLVIKMSILSHTQAKLSQH